MSIQPISATAPCHVPETPQYSAHQNILNITIQYSAQYYSTHSQLRVILTSLQKKPGSFSCHKWEDDKLLVSGPACKDLGSSHFHPHNKKKAEQTENQQLFLGSIQEQRSQGKSNNLERQTDRYKESQLTIRSRNHQWNQYQGRKT